MVDNVLAWGHVAYQTGRKEVSKDSFLFSDPVSLSRVWHAHLYAPGVGLHDRLSPLSRDHIMSNAPCPAQGGVSGLSDCGLPLQCLLSCCSSTPSSRSRDELWPARGWTGARRVSGGPRSPLIERTSRHRQGLQTPQIRFRPELFLLRLRASRASASISLCTR